MVFKFGEHQIDLGNIDFEAKDFKMGNDTSYAEKFIKKYKHSKHYREELLPLKLQCLQNIKDYIGDNYEHYFDLLAGLGISGKIFATECLNEFNDFSEDCLNVIRNNDFKGRTLMYQKDMFELKFGKNQPEFIFADFNNFTTKRYLTLYKPVVDNIFASAQKYVLINDCSVFYLKYGQKSYDTYRKLLGDHYKKSFGDDLNGFYPALKSFYKEQYKEWDLCLVEYFKDTSFLLFKNEKVPQKMPYQTIIHCNHKEGIKIKTELI